MEEDPFSSVDKIVFPVSCSLPFFLALSGFLLAYNLKEREKDDEMCSLSTEIRPTTTSNDKLQSW